MQKTILRVSSYPTIEKPGMGLHPYKLCSIDGYQTLFLTPRDQGRRFAEPRGTKLIEVAFGSEPRPQKASLVKRSLFTLKRLLYVFWFCLAGLKLLLSHRIHIVHIHSPMYWPVAFYGWLLGKKVCITFHGTDFYRIQNSWLYRKGAFVFSKVFSISPEMTARLSEIHGDNVVYDVFNGVDPAIFVDKKAHVKHQFLAVGSLKEEKGFEYLIEAFGRLTESAPELSCAQLNIVGEGVLGSQLEALIEELGQQDRIRLIGHRGQQELVDLYNASEFFVLSSVSEGFPKVLLEAMSCGCKVIATRVGCVDTVLAGYDFLSPSRDPEALAKVMLDCVNQFQLSSDGEFIASVVQEHTWSAVQQTYKKKYEELL